MKITMPRPVLWAIQRLEERGYQAYAVGGCVRDALLGRTPKDWDIATSASPEEMKRVFSGEKLLETGIQHGTLTLLRENMPLEITTFRIEGNYSDRRHPDSVAFTDSLKEDLRRRDFTVNAMACHPDLGLFDDWGGLEDLKNGRLRCVGEAEKRFQEDALRILRGLRFASELGFSIEEETKKAVHCQKDSLRYVAAERLAAELDRLLIGKNAVSVLREYVDVIGVFLPELLPMVGFNQKNPHHDRDVWEHTLGALEESPMDLTVRLAVLFHDVGKPSTFTMDENGIGHFYGHAKRGAEMTAPALERLRYDKATKELVVKLVEEHNLFLEPNSRAVKRAMNRYGERFPLLLQIKRADIFGQSPAYFQENIVWLERIEALTTEIRRRGECFQQKDLRINGNDLLEIGIPKGKAIGESLQWLLNQVIEDRVPNSREKLLEEARAHQCEKTEGGK